MFGILEEYTDYSKLRQDLTRLTTVLVMITMIIIMVSCFLE